jgi:hypothetical protein
MALELKFKNGRPLIENNKLVQNCCRWKVTGYTTAKIGDPACESTPRVEVSDLCFTGTPATVARAAINGFIEVACNRDLAGNPIPNDNPLYAPCVSTSIPWTSGELVSTTCNGNSNAVVRFEFEDCPAAAGDPDSGALDSRDLAVLVSLEACP